MSNETNRRNVKKSKGKENQMKKGTRKVQQYRSVKTFKKISKTNLRKRINWMKATKLKLYP